MRPSRRWGFRGSMVAAVFAVCAMAVPGVAQAIPGDTAATTPVILISVDTLRADHLGCFGYSRLRTPNIDSLAQGGTLFTEISSQAPITLPSHVSLFTSTYPFANGIRENGQVLPAGTVTLATVLASHGYKTAAFIGGYFLERRFGLAQGFSTYDSPFDSRALNGALDLKRPAAEVLGAAERWLQSNGNGPFFLFVHLFDLHQPYDAPAAYRARAPQSEYDQEVAYVDDSLAGFFAYLKKSGLAERSLLVLFSDHGESLGDHGETTHGYFVYRSTLHVPLIFHWPEREERRNSKIGDRDSKIENRKPAAPAERVTSPAGLIDVAPTILSFLGFAPPATFCGHGLLGLMKAAGSPPRDVYSESSYAHDKFGWAVLRSLRRSDYQYIDAPHPELYNLKQDPGELHNLLSGESALATSLREALTGLIASYRRAPVEEQESAGAVLPGSAEKLRSLGYLEITAPKAALDNSGTDPKDRLFEYKRFLLAGHLERIGKVEEAAAEFQSILDNDPQNLPAFIELARADVGLHRYLDGANQLRAALALDPRNVEAEELLGDIWLKAGDDGRAAAEFERLLAFAPHDDEAQFGLGVVAAHHGRTSEAAGHFRAALAANPRSAQAHYQLGLILEAENHKPEATREFQAAVDCDPQLEAAKRELDRLAASGR